jgi:AcrR family transcriptional regulator
MLKLLDAAIVQVAESASKMTITAVAKEAGISAAAVLTTYPDVAERIRTIQGKAMRQQRNAKIDEVKQLEARNRELREELAQAQADLQTLASINQTLRDELHTLHASGRPNVTPFPSSGGPNGNVPR